VGSRLVEGRVRGGRTADPVIRRCSTSIRMPKAWLAAVCGVSRAGASNDDAAVRALAQIDEVNSSGHADDDTRKLLLWDSKQRGFAIMGLLTLNSLLWDSNR
jgi:hypothetical protein